jgi:hypothetical protein
MPVLLMCNIDVFNVLFLANFSMLQQYTIGSGAHTVPVTSWEGPYLGSLWMNIHFVDGSCEPVSLQIYGPTPDNGDYFKHSI